MPSRERTNFLRASQGGHRKRTLAVRAMAGEIAWLDGRLRWHAGRVAWEHEHGTLAPSGADLALARRRLGQIARYPIAARRTLGDLEAWLALRLARLEQAQWLQQLSAPDLSALAGRALHEPAVRLDVAPLLAAEALCVDELPAAPSAALLTCGVAALPALRALLADAAAPEAGRALAALLLGTLAGQVAHADYGQVDVSFPAGSGWLRRCYEWGRAEGVSTPPALLVALLQPDDGAALTRRYELAMAAAPRFALTSQQLRELIAGGLAPAQAVALLEALAEAERLAQRLLTHPEPLLSKHARRRGASQPSFPAAERRGLVAPLVQLMQAYALANQDPELITVACAWCHGYLDLGYYYPSVAKVLLATLGTVRDLPPELQKPALELLLELRGYLWGASKRIYRHEGWPNGGYKRVSSLVALLKASGDAGVVRDAQKLDIVSWLCDYRWEPARFRYLMRLLAFAGNDPSLVYPLGRVLDRAGSFTQAQLLFQPLQRALAPITPQERAHALEMICQEVNGSRQTLRARLPILARYAARVARFGESYKGSWCLCTPLLRAALALDAHAPAQADVLFDALLELLGAQEDLDDWGTICGLRFTAPLAAMVAGDPARYLAITRVALEHHVLGPDSDALDQALELLPRYPLLRDALGTIFVQQPRRCAALLVRLVLASKLGHDVLASLEVLQLDLSEALDYPLPPAWQPLLELAPELAPLAGSYLYAQWLRGASLEIPAGVARALREPERVARELAHLEGVLTQAPVQHHLAARAASLRARLAEPARMHAAVRQEVGERLRQLSAEAQLAAAEQQIDACYRARLESVAGPLPAGLLLDEHLLNATLLSATIHTNRKLLLRLLRAALRDDRGWRELHPANMEFLRGLGERGVDVASWLSAFPRSYACPGVAGRRVTLTLEQDPLRILQMGNYFDTCLSADSMNAFSTVANAVELNKRVVYAVDGAGRVVARKLIAIGQAGDMLGFHTYASAGSEDNNKALRAIVARYLRAFAARCGLRLANEGTVPRLFAEAWYDDGVVSWEQLDEPPQSSPSRHRVRPDLPAGAQPRPSLAV